MGVRGSVDVPCTGIPLTYEPMLRAPRRGDDVTHGPVAYWSSLLHLIVYGFGWVRPDRGLRWWYQNGRPLADDRLRLISQVWDADEQLNYFAAWLWTTPRILDASLVAEATGYIMDDDMPLRPDDRWTDEQVSWAEALKLPRPRRRRLGSVSSLAPYRRTSSAGGRKRDAPADGTGEAPCSSAA